MVSKKQRLQTLLYGTRAIAGMVLLGLGYVFFTTTDPWSLMVVAWLIGVSWIIPVVGTVTSLVVLYPFGYLTFHCPYCGVPHFEKPEVKEFDCSECGTEDYKIHHADIGAENHITFCSDRCRSDYEYFGADT